MVLSRCVGWIQRCPAETRPEGAEPCVPNCYLFKAKRSPLFAELNWQKLEKLILEKDIVTIYKIINEETYSENLKSLVESRAAVSARRTRAVEAGQLQLPKVRTERARRFFMYRAVASWNGTTAPVREAPNAESCRRRVKAGL